MNTDFNTIETIRTDSTITNKSKAYIEACDNFEIEASQFAVNSNFISRKCAEEVSKYFVVVKNADCEFTMYVNAKKSEGFLSKAWNMAD